MLFFNIQRILDVRGIENHYRWLTHNGIVPQTATTWLKYEIGYVKAKHIELLCNRLNCTPNDLFEWREDTKTVLHDTHALRSLKRDATARSIADMTRAIPADKLEKLGELLLGLKENGEGDHGK